MIRASCHCGAVGVAVAHAPETLTNCNCSICRRYGTLWAYYSLRDVEVTAAPGATEAYAWKDRKLRFVRCASCGCVTHWEPMDRTAFDRMGVNARNFDPEQLGPVRIRRLDGAATEEYLD